MINEKENDKTKIYQQIVDLKSQLTSHESPIGDWKGIKQREFVDLGLTPQYSEEDMKEYHKKRQAVRAKINELEELIKN